MNRVERMARALAADGDAPRPLELIRPQAPVLTAATIVSGVSIFATQNTLCGQYTILGNARGAAVRMRHGSGAASASALVGDRLARLAG